MRIASEPGTDSGEILVRGPAVFAGYFAAVEASREALQGGWLHTGDIGTLDAGGNLYVLGRKRGLLKRGGAPLAPRELEEAAERVPGIRLAAAVGLPPTPGGSTEEIVVAVEADPATAGSPFKLAAAATLATLAIEAIEAAVGFAPDAVLVLAPRTIPRTPNGKTRHQLLCQQLASGEIERDGSVLFSSRRPAGPAE